MLREISRWRTLANLVLVLVIVALAGFGLSRVARRHWTWQETFHARARFRQIGGLEIGAKARVQGIDAGVVEAIEPPTAPGEPVTVVLRLDRKLRGLVRADAVAQIAVQGVVGARVIEITPGRADAPLLADGGSLRAEAPVELADLLRDASATLQRVNAVARAAEEGLHEVNAIASVIRRGEGTLGRLVQDDEAYEKILAVSDRGERTLNDLDENLAALKRTWPISRYFEGRSFYDLDHVLYQPGAVRERRTLADTDLFEPGRAVLTQPGRKRLDEVAAWFKKQVQGRKATTVVIAAFTDAPRDADLARILTQEQADAVRSYLVAHHGISSNGWFSSRKVAAVGFGTQRPRPEIDPAAGLPARRVEISLFTPQT
jgi:phospholipid/cholesterol/gamma-HCH transport system substrate-binding protein